MEHEYPILEYDETAEAMIEPHSLLLIQFCHTVPQLIRWIIQE